MNIDEWNDEMCALAQRWALWMAKPFPSGLAGMNIDACDLVLLCEDIMGLVGSAVERRPLKRGGVNRLSRLLEELRSDLPSVTEAARPHYEELVEMAEKAIELSRSAAGG